MLHRVEVGLQRRFHGIGRILEDLDPSLLLDEFLVGMGKIGLGLPTRCLQPPENLPTIYRLKESRRLTPVPSL